jgi:NAD(P)-dependent dehydrogenase (short-subunit alcohol dehydrogenase family)
MLLKDKVVVVSGIGPGLGIKLAIEAAREGAAGVVAAARTAAKLEEAEAKIRELGLKTPVLKVVNDITKDADCANLVKASVEKFGRIDALVNSAYYHGDMDYASTAKLDSWLPTLETNLPPLGEAGYASSKGALAVAAKFLAKELGPAGIRVNTVHMGWMWGAPVEGYFQWQAQETGTPIEKLKERISSQIPIGRIPPDEECARAALFMVSDYASVVTGATLDVNGGHYMP